MLGHILYLSVSNNVIYGIIEHHDIDSNIIEKARFKYDFNPTSVNVISRGEAVLNFCYHYGKYRKLQVAGVNNQKLYNNMLTFFDGDEEMFSYFFDRLDERLNCEPMGVSGFAECGAVKEKLTNSDIEIYYLNSVIDFGKHQGKTIQQIFDSYPGYLKYLESTGKVFSNSVKNILKYL